MHSDLNDLAVGLPHSEIPGSKLGYQLPWAYRRFLRPSSPLDAKTSTVCPFTLGHVDRMPSDRLSSDRRSLIDAHAGPSCSFGPATCCTRLGDACCRQHLKLILDRCLPSNRANVMRAQPARLRDLSTIESHALVTEHGLLRPRRNARKGRCAGPSSLTKPERLSRGWEARNWREFRVFTPGTGSRLNRPWGRHLRRLGGLQRARRTDPRGRSSRGWRRPWRDGGR